jgi:hypothetical protein
MTTLRRIRDRLREEEGSLSAFLLVVVVVLVVVIGLVVDSAGKYSADSQAEQIAANAARTAVNSINGDTVLVGATALNAAEAQTAAEQYLAAAGVTGTVTVSGQVVSVEVETTYTTRFVSLVGINSLTGTGSASAQLITE